MRPALLIAVSLALLGSLAVATPQSRKDGKRAKKRETASIPWIRDHKAGLQLAKQTGRPLVLNFWCGT